MQLEDRGGHTTAELSETAQKVIAAARQRPEIGSVYTAFAADTPGYELEIDRDKVAREGVSLSDLYSTLQSFYGSYQSMTSPSLAVTSRLSSRLLRNSVKPSMPTTISMSATRATSSFRYRTSSVRNRWDRHRSSLVSMTIRRLPSRGSGQWLQLRRRH